MPFPSGKRSNSTPEWYLGLWSLERCAERSKNPCAPTPPLALVRIAAMLLRRERERGRERERERERGREREEEREREWERERGRERERDTERPFFNQAELTGGHERESSV